MLAIQALGQLLEKWHHNLLELRCLRELQDLLQLAQEQDFLLAVGHRPELQQSLKHWVRQLAVLLNKLSYTVCQLLVVHCHALGLVKWHQRSLQEQLVLLLQWQCKAVDDGPKDFQQLCHSVVPLSLKDEPVEDIVDCLANERSVHHELAIDAMQNGLQVVPLPWVLRIKQLKQLEHECLVDVLLSYLGVCIVGYHIPQEELVYNLKMRPCRV
mmetsp:Transcript_36934/g.82122  ORF Transcript_36934/g.82122 Transcript_36934/m.82122 type:complete len:213 (+) Transcript_36934:1576-2214(+)